MHLPDVLHGLADELKKALTYPIPGTWLEGEPFEAADQPTQVARVLIRGLHPRLINAKIAYLFREKMARRGRVRLGVAAKASSKIAYLAGYHFVLEFNWTAWRQLSPEQRIALVDHELCHCERDPESDAYLVRHHDVEEFSEIVRRWGLWTPDLRGFGLEIGQALGAVQGDMFDPEAERKLDQVLEEAGATRDPRIEVVK